MEDENAFVCGCDLEDFSDPIILDEDRCQKPNETLQEFLDRAKDSEYISDEVYADAVNRLLS